MKHTSKELSKQLATIKSNAISSIKELMKEHEITHIDFTDCDDCPIVIEGDYDENTYTLDDLNIEDNKLAFYCSSCNETARVGEKGISADCLISILECLEKYDFLFEGFDEEEEED